MIAQTTDEFAPVCPALVNCSHVFMISENESDIPVDAEVRQIFGIVGIIRLLAGTFMLTACEE